MSSPDAPRSAEQVNLACFQLSRTMDELSCSVAEAAPFARTLLRVVGRVVIDTAAPNAQPEVWASTEVMALQWLNEALGSLGYEVRPLAGSGRPEVPAPSSEWT
ncbi:MAG: hypothetical protein JF888_13370 [Candidatus Dormibacteraeota bacterium]|uniref:Uncharacterized protein n=1 Tax=Candidatus Dormiibacter inghamiae TaxID=3127013 RepID=A0A934NHY0_9BACT|nr:hypothetical protein [Candidatus Dormibacteraeota bacterium]MBJ7606420.1 hypothetical protein [Candidatus Dormibacteraeota bacterium]